MDCNKRFLYMFSCILRSSKTFDHDNVRDYLSKLIFFFLFLFIRFGDCSSKSFQFSTRFTSLFWLIGSKLLTALLHPKFKREHERWRCVLAWYSCNLVFMEPFQNVLTQYRDVRNPSALRTRTSNCVQ